MADSNDFTHEALQSLILLKNASNSIRKCNENASDDSDEKRSHTSSVTNLSRIASPIHAAQVQVNPEMDTKIARPNDKDILSGRGTGVNVHLGNVFFRELVHANKESYVNAKAPEKKRLIKKIVEITKANGHRFLKQDPSTKLWTTLSHDEAKKKTAQALRENAPIIKKQQLEQLDEKHFTAKKAKLKRKLNEDIQFQTAPFASPLVGSTQNRSATTSPVPVNVNEEYASQLGHLLLLNESLSISSRLKSLREKQAILKKLEREIVNEQRELMQELCEATQNLTQPNPSHQFNGMNGNRNFDINFFQHLIKRRRIANNLDLL